MKNQAFAAVVILWLGACCSAAPLPKGQPKELAILEGHPYDVVALAFSPDGAFLYPPMGSPRRAGTEGVPSPLTAAAPT
jgi:hypothetical protein